jgi:hypothetical protein
VQSVRLAGVPNVAAAGDTRADHHTAWRWPGRVILACP